MTQSDPHHPTPPLHVQPLGYSMPPARRPALVTAIGVISIVVAALGILTNLSFGMQSFGLMILSQMRAPFTKIATASPAPAGIAFSPPAVGPRGLGEVSRRAALEGLTSVRSLAPRRREQLDALLRQSGMDLFPFDASQITPQRVKENVSDSGRLPDSGDRAGRLLHPGQRPDRSSRRTGSILPLRWRAGRARKRLTMDWPRFFPTRQRSRQPQPEAR